MNQLCLLSATATGKRLGNGGMKRVLDKEVDAWVRLATDRVRRLADAHISFTIDDVYDAVGAPPRHFNSAGALLGNLAKNGFPIDWTGRMVPSRRASRHGSLVRVWIGA